MYSQDWSQIVILSWGARATGINLDWCLTPGIKQNKKQHLYRQRKQQKLPLWTK
jgi:hypothetical protein